MAGVTASGVPLVFGIPEPRTGELQAIVALLLVAAACAGFMVVFLHRPNRPFGLSIASAFGRAPPAPVLYPEYRVDTKGWTLDLLKKLEWRRFEELCAAYFGVLGFAARTTRVAAAGGAAIDL